MKVLAKALAFAAFALVASAQTAIAQEAVSPEAYGFSSAEEMNNYFSVAEVTVTESAAVLDATTEATLLDPNDALIKSGNDALDSLQSVILNPSNIPGWIALGKKAWEVVVKNQPVLNVSTQRVSVLPQEQPNWGKMENWKAPAARSYTISAKNGYGAETIKHTYTVAYNYGGQVNGKGAFLANATIIPTQVDVAWGYTLNSNVEVGQILNMGTVDNPTPGVDLQLKYSMKTLLKKSQGVDSFFVGGNGSLKHTTRQ